MWIDEKEFTLCFVEVVVLNVSADLVHLFYYLHVLSIASSCSQVTSDACESILLTLYNIFQNIHKHISSDALYFILVSFLYIYAS